VSKTQTMGDEKSRHASIIQFVIDNPNCTKADVIRYMKGRSSINTTHAILINLINEGKIIKHEKNLQTHLLTINEKNKFIKIYNELSETDQVINSLDEFSHTTHSDDLQVNFIKPLVDAINDFLMNRLVMTNDNKILSDIDRQILYKKNSQLMFHLTIVSQHIGFSQDIDNLIAALEEEKDLRGYTRLPNVKINDLIAIMKNFSQIRSRK
jgi:hypothetical protein